MKKLLPLFLLIIFFAASAAQAETASQQNQSKAPGEIAKPEVKGDTIYVNNKICAVSRTQMREADLGKFVSKVTYTGDNPKYKKYKGKELAFNQCCGMCLKSFPKKWSENADEILQFHGL